MSHKLSIYHVGSSDRNPINWYEVKTILTDFWNSNVSPSRVSKSNVVFSSNKLKTKASQLSRTIPISVYSRLAPFLGTQHVKNVQKLVKAE